VLSEGFRQRPTAEWLALLKAHEVPCAPIQDVATAAADPQTLAREMIVTVHDPQAGPQRVVNTPLRFSETRASVRASSPRLGEHTQAVLEEWLGHDVSRH
jgi:crotonobetainyl-CoA:carnitine CoA-transferase CaiB-like acyl-CoA transferase